VVGEGEGGGGLPKGSCGVGLDDWLQNGLISLREMGEGGPVGVFEAPLSKFNFMCFCFLNLELKIHAHRTK
jgi:hypothetical protein